MIPSLPVFSKSDGADHQLRYLGIALSDDDQALTDPWFKDEPLLVSIRSRSLRSTYTSEINTADLFLSIWESGVDTSLGEVVDRLRCRKGKRR